jgi:hypothetical protein
MTRILSSILAAGFAVILLVGLYTGVQASAATNGGMQRPSGTPEFVRIVTITVVPSANPFTSGLITRWQIEELQHEEGAPYDISIPSDAYAVTVTLSNGNNYTITQGRIVIPVAQSQYFFEYYTGQRAPRIGNQFGISQSASNNRPYHYIGTVLYPGPDLHYVGYAGFVPTITVGSLHWFTDAIAVPIPNDVRYRFASTIWLSDTRIPVNPDLKIVTATLNTLGETGYITAVVKNNGITLTAAPAYIDVYDLVNSASAPTSPLGLSHSLWCTSDPLNPCQVGYPSNPLPSLAPGQEITFTSGFSLPEATGRHDLYVYVDALGGNNGLNSESNENNNAFLAGSVGQFYAFLPVIQK